MWVQDLIHPRKQAGNDTIDTFSILGAYDDISLERIKMPNRGCIGII
jgi:hypothetical protein